MTVTTTSAGWLLELTSQLLPCVQTKLHRIAVADFNRPEAALACERALTPGPIPKLMRRQNSKLRLDLRNLVALRRLCQIRLQFTDGGRVVVQARKGIGPRYVKKGI